MGGSYAGQRTTGCGGYLEKRASLSATSQSRNREPLPLVMTRRCRQASQRLGDFWEWLTDGTDEKYAYGKVNEVVVELLEN